MLLTDEMPSSRILVVEDDALLRESLYSVLDYAGYEVITARHGLDGLNVLRDTDAMPDLILSDMCMDEMNGYQFLTALRAESQWQTIPFVFLSGRLELDADSDVLQGLGVADYVTKPFPMQTLLTAVQRAIS
jgi:CheY-like chemotaxis protein